MPSFKESMPIGTIIHSMLTETQIQLYYGDGWILSDGRSISGSVLAAITSQTNAPDLRGRFLRAKDNAAGNDPNGDSSLGTTRTYQNASHTHTGGAHTHGLNTYNLPGGAGANPAVALVATVAGSTTTGSDGAVSTASSGGVDTQPMCAIVNAFIKIN